MNFNQHLIVTIVDKLAIGFLILFAGLIFNKVLEKYKSRQAFETEIAKQRVAKIGEVWALLYEWESLVKGLIRRVAEMQLEFGNNRELLEERLETEIQPSMVNSENKSKNIQLLVEQNRFWLGEELYVHFLEYHNNIMNYTQVFASGNYQEFKELDEKLENSKHNVVKVLQIVK
jgi:hypothetical protein